MILAIDLNPGGTASPHLTRDGSISAQVTGAQNTNLGLQSSLGPGGGVGSVATAIGPSLLAFPGPGVFGVEARPEEVVGEMPSLVEKPSEPKTPAWRAQALDPASVGG